MKLKRIRPRFTIETSLSVETIKALITQKLEDPATRFSGTIAQNYIIINVPEEESHFWSPRLTMECTHVNGKTRLTGQFGPGPVVWMLFMGFYIAAIFLMFVGFMWGGAQLSLGMRPTGFYFLGAGIILFILGYLGALMGQRFSTSQMHELQAFLEDIIHHQVLKDALVKIHQ